MNPIAETYRFDYKPEQFKDLKCFEKEKLLYEQGISIVGNSDYRKIVLEISYETRDSIPDVISIYCFNRKTNIEKGLYTYFSFPNFNILKPHDRQKKQTLIIDFSKDMIAHDFPNPLEYQITKIGIFLNDVTSNISFTCKILNK